MSATPNPSHLAPDQAFLVSHTHWDREWYLPYNRFRVNLVEVVGKVLDALETDSHFNNFVLDGQCAVLEDYLESVPEDKERVSTLIRQGKLAVGPWYILPDEFLVSGEATVRNLIFGAKVAAPFGSVQQVGYMPDSFGHIAQIPQILQLCHINSFIFTRGLDDRADELGWLFRWAAPDGSEVLAVNQCDGYCNAAGLGFKEIWHAHTQRKVNLNLAVEKIGSLFEKMAQRPGFEPALLNNGCDHFPPQQDFDQILKALREKFPQTTFTHGLFEDFLTAARNHTADKDRPLFEGELLGGKDHLILSGVWSARMNLKMENDSCQNLLTRYVEPLATMAAFATKKKYPRGLIDSSWRELLRNHPHDSICGCSTDSVHLDMDTRFAAVRQTGEQLLNRTLDHFTPMFATEESGDRETVICIANPLPMRRDVIVDRLVVLQPLNYDVDRLSIVDENDKPVPFQIIDRRFIERFWGIDYRAELFCQQQLEQQENYIKWFGPRILGTAEEKDTKDCFVWVRFLARDMPAVGFKQFFLKDKKALTKPEPMAPVTAYKSGDEVEIFNEHIHVVFRGDGTFDLEDKATGSLFVGLNLLEDSEDIGDEYDFCHAEIGGLFFAGGNPGKVRIIDKSDLACTAEASFRFDLPRSISKDRKSRDPRTTPTDVYVRITVQAGSRRVDIETDFNNRAFDHRLRAWFPTGLTTDTVISDGHFMFNRRPLSRPTNPQWSQPSPPTWPQQDFSALQDGDCGLAILNQGLPEFETWLDPDNGAIFALTLLRSVDWLSRDDFSSRNCTNAGPTIHTPNAQCYGRHTFRYSVVPYAGDVLQAQIKDESERYRVPCIGHQGVRDGMLAGGVSFLEKTSPKVAISAIKMSEHGNDLVVRMVNLSEEQVQEVLHIGLPALDATKVGLREDQLTVDRSNATVTHGGNQICIPLAPFEIATVIIELNEQDEITT